MKTKKGCLITALENKEVDFIFHQCNCFNTFGRGVAATIKKRIPNAYKADLETISGDRGKLGRFTYADGVYNIYGQYTYGTKKQETVYLALAVGLNRAVGDIITNKGLIGANVGVPLIGCGLAGGDWGVVEGMLEVLEKEYDINFTLYEL